MKVLNKNWRDQNEKYYLKSLDHQGVSFKQNDIKYLRSKSLINEIQTIAQERTEKQEQNYCETQELPHMVFIYPDKFMFEYACNLIIHHVKRQASVHKEDKQKIKQLIRNFIPDMFSIPRGVVSDDELEDEESSDSRHNGSNNKASSGKYFNW